MDEHKRDGRNIEAKRRRRKAWYAVRPFVILLISLCICLGGLYSGFEYVNGRFFQPVDINDATPITVTISSGSGASSIARKLYEAGGVDENGNLLASGLITSKTVFKIYVDFTGKSDKLKAGTYVLSRNMDIEQIVNVICEGNPPRTTVKLTITEGMTAEEIAKKLVALGVFESSDVFLDECSKTEDFEDYSFIKNLESCALDEREYALEGYLFPDTYEIYTDESAKSIINRLLYRFFQVMTDEYIARAKELGMTEDEVVTLASLIEKEAKVDADFARVSAVFHLRLQQGMKLESDAPLKYIFKTTGRVTFTKSQLDSDSPYNTYVVGGLPTGPICNPGLKSITAALYPDEGYLEEGYLFFCLMDSETGALAFAKTNAEHEANIEVYSPDW